MLNGLLLKIIEIKLFSSIYAPFSGSSSRTGGFAFKAWLREP